MIPNELLGSQPGPMTNVPPIFGAEPGFNIPSSSGPGQAPPFSMMSDMVSAPPMEPIPIGPPEPSRLHQDEAFEYFSACCREAAEFVENKKKQLQRLEALYKNELALSDWNNGAVPDTSQSRKRRRNIGAQETRWYADEVFAISPIVDQRVESLTNQIFTNEEYFECVPELGPLPEFDPSQFPTARKLQTLLVRSLNTNNFQSRLREFIWQGVLFGVALGKVVWREEYNRKWFLDPVTGQHLQVDDLVNEGPQLQCVNLAKALIDPHARSGDCQEWDFVGHREFVPYDVIRRRFGKDGPYNLNKTKFNERWDDGQSIAQAQFGLLEDSDSFSISSDSRRYLQVWEIHGRLFFSDETRPVECNATIITDVGDNDPSGGVMVRLYETTTTVIGKRPFVFWQYAPGSEVFSQGIIEQNEDIIYQISHLVNLFIDGVRLTTVPMIKAQHGSPCLSDLENVKKGNVIYPGKIWKFRDAPNEIEPFQLQLVGLSNLLQIIQWLEQQLQRRTAVADMSRGMSSTRKSATEAHAIAEAAVAPVHAVVSVFEKEVLRPFGQLCLGLFKQFLVDDQEVRVKTKDGQFQPITLSIDEIQNGSYTVRAALSNETQGRVAKAQTINQIIPVLKGLAPDMLMQEGKKLSVSGLLEEMLRLLDFNKIDNIIQDATPQDKEQFMAMMAPPGMAQGGPQGPMSGGTPNQGPPNPGAPGGGGGNQGPTQMPTREEMMAMSQAGGGNPAATPRSPDGGGGPITSQLEQLLTDLKARALVQNPQGNGGAR